MAKTSSADRRRHWQGVIGVSTALFYTWRRKLRVGSRRTRRPSLVPVRVVKDGPECHGRLEVQWSSG